MRVRVFIVGRTDALLPTTNRRRKRGGRSRDFRPFVAYNTHCTNPKLDAIMRPVTPPAVSRSAAASRRLLLPHQHPQPRPQQPSDFRPIGSSAAARIRTAASPARRPIAAYTITNTTATARIRYQPYHSYDHPPPAGPFSPPEAAILAAAYRHVPQHGFSPEALARGARDAGYLDISTNLLPEGPFSLIRWHLTTQREALAARTAALPDASSVTDKVEALTWERLLGNVEIIGRWQDVCMHALRCPIN